ncbi:hypothetical protein BJV82DRAFT_520434 [Fennellomyces sp. T-0311]|nr:hypothetical protein BJV82DRAFT_520434 [Fennellomyces sp. T-0311]
MMLIEVGIPLALYYGLRNTIGVLYALVISGIPPFLYVIFVAIRNRRIDVLGCIIGISFILSGVVSIVSGDERAALIRDSAVAAVIGGMFLVTLLPIHTKWLTIRPLNYIMAQQMMAAVKYKWTDKDGNRQEQNVMVWQWDHIRYFRISMYLQTAAWGVLLILELMACILMVQSDMTVDEVVMYNNILTSTVVAVMVSASIAAGIYGHMLEKRIGKRWTEENDFTEKYASRQQNGAGQIQRNSAGEQLAANMA